MTFLNKEELIKSVLKKIWQTKETLSTIECQMSYLASMDLKKQEAYDICYHYSNMLVVSDGVNQRIQGLAKIIEGVE